MRAILKIASSQKDKFKEVLKISNELRIVDISFVSEGDDYFEIEYQREQHLFNLGRAFEPYKMPANMGSSFTINYDNSYMQKI